MWSLFQLTVPRTLARKERSTRGWEILLHVAGVSFRSFVLLEYCTLLTQGLLLAAGILLRFNTAADLMALLICLLAAGLFVRLGFDTVVDDRDGWIFVSSF